MSFSSMNAVNASKGMQGTNRQSEATFTGQGAPLQGPAQGMGPAQPAPMAQAQGSSYSLGAGMAGTGRAPLTGTSAAGNHVGLMDLPDANGVVAGRQMGNNLAPVGPGLSQQEMQDPENAALAGFQFSQSQDQPVPQQRQVQVPQQASPGSAAQAAPQPHTPQGPPTGPTMASATGRGALQQAPLQAPKPPQYGRVM